jgi:NADH pyrophosphatase NudC (nudix superfamily)
MGVKIVDPKLCGMFTQKWQGSNPPTIMQYYKAKYSSGDLKVPSDCTDIKWFSFDEAIKTIPYEVMTSMMKQIKKNPGKIIGAAFERYKDANSATKYKTLEDFYIMN